MDLKHEKESNRFSGVLPGISTRDRRQIMEDAARKLHEIEGSTF